MAHRLWFAFNCFGVGVYFAFIGCHLRPGLAMEAPLWADVAMLLLLASMAAFTFPGRA